MSDDGPEPALPGETYDEYLDRVVRPLVEAAIYAEFDRVFPPQETTT